MEGNLLANNGNVWGVGQGKKMNQGPVSDLTFLWQENETEEKLAI